VLEESYVQTQKFCRSSGNETPAALSSADCPSRVARWHPLPGRWGHGVPRLSRSAIPYSTRSRMGSGCSPRYSTQAFFAHG
jgi:hypothetical protein